MKNTKEAIRYGIETLKVSPEKMFSLIESSEGYDGEDYSRWLAAQIIKIAEKDGIGYTQLLVKKFSITQSLIEDYSDNSIREEWLNYLKEILEEDDRSVYSVGLDVLGNTLEDIDWFNGIDLDEVNGDFVNERLPDEVRDAFVEDNGFTLLCKLSSDTADKGSELYKEAKARGIVCKSEGALMMYRACSMISAFDSCTENFRFAFLASTGFLTDRDNADIIKYFLSYFNYYGFTVDASDLLESSFVSGGYVFVLCRPRTLGDCVQDGIVLPEAHLKDGEVEFGVERRYSKSDVDMLDYLLKNSKNTGELVPSYGEDGNIVIAPIGKADSLGYLVVDRYGGVVVKSLPVIGEVNLPITEDNLSQIVTFFSVVKSLEGFGLAKIIKEFITGHMDYKELFYNCLPLFLFDTGNKCMDNGITRLNGNIVRLENKLSIYSDIVSELLEKGEVYFSFESKQLLDICKGFLDFLSNEENSSLVGKTFEEVRKESNNEELNRQYMFALNSLKDYVSTLYRKME